MSLLVVHFDNFAENFAVVNTFDGVVVERFYTKVDAEDFAREHEATEAERIANQYDQR